MQKINNIFFKAALAVILTVLATGCIFEKMDAPKNLQNVLIEVNVSAGQMTKATEAATELEKTINSLRIYAFHNGRLAGHYYRLGTSADPIYMDLELPDGTPSVDFYVVANEVNMQNGTSYVVLTDKMTAAEIEKLSFTTFSTGAGLPMYCKATRTLTVPELTGSSTVNTAEGHQDHFLLPDKVTFSLSRPIAKIAFFAGSKSESAAPIIEEVAVYAKGTRQFMYLFEQPAASLEEIPVGTENKILFAGKKVVDKTVTEENRSVVNAYTSISDPAYLSEIPHGSDNWDEQNSFNSVVLHVKYRVKEGADLLDGYVHMPAIIRNHFYKVLCLISPEGGLMVDYMVSDWEKVDDWNLSYEYPTYEVSTPSVKKAATMYYDAGGDGGAFSLNFRMTAPSGQKWTPTIQADAADYVVRVYNGSTEIPAPVEASPNTYTIKVIPLKPENIGVEVKFIITYTPTWAMHSELLLINEGVMWTGTGATDDLIVIRQVDKN